MNLRMTYTNSIRLFLLIVLVLTFAVSAVAYAQSTGYTNTDNSSSTEKVKKKLDPYSTENNIGYDNFYLKLFRAGKINTPPPMGGPVTDILRNCFDGVTWVAVGAPRPGWYIHMQGVTRTYTFGPPTHIGQFLLGLYAPKKFCAKNVGMGLITLPGLLITMMGSSM